MRDLIRLSDEELHELTTPQRLRMFVAVGIAMACGIVSLQGMAALFTEATVVPLPGMQHAGGQIAWAICIVAMLIVVTFLVRGVVKRRLQWGITLSLLIHFLLCLSMTTVEFRGPLTIPVQAEEFSDVPREEFTLPDYAGMEIPNAESPWRQPTETETPESEMEPDRPEIEIAEAVKAEAADTAEPQQAEAIETPERQEKVDLAAEASEEMERQLSMNPQAAVSAADQPEVATASSEAAKLEAQVERQKQASEVPITEPEEQSPAVAPPAFEASQLQASRTEAAITPETIETSRASRTVTQVQAALSPAESTAVATSDARPMEAQEQSLETARQQAQAASESAADPAMMAAPSSADQATITSTALERATVTAEMAELTPADGGPVSIVRNAAEGMITAVGESAAESAAMSAADSSEGAPISASPTAKAGRRATDAKVPVGEMTAGSSPGASSAPGRALADGQVQTAKVARATVGGNQPEVGVAGVAPSAISRGAGRQASAVGSAVKEAGLAAVGSRGVSDGQALMAGPAKTSVARRATGLPSSANAGVPGNVNSPGNGSSSSAIQAGVPTGGLRKATAAVASGRAAEPRAELGTTERFADGTPSRLAMSRATSAAATGLPSGSAEAEQSGTLVFAGPQATKSDGGISGPRPNSLPRRSAGLPGATGPTGQFTAPAGGGSQPTKMAARPERSGVGSDRPSLASAETIAGLVKRSVQGVGGASEARIPESLSMRATDARREAARTLGGSDASEESVERGLEWLVRNQYPDGHWSIHDFPGEDSPSLGQGSFESNSAATGLALLAYLGAGYTHQSGKHQDTVNRGMTWLLERQKSNGDLFADETEFVWFYSHGIASIAVCEAYGLTKDAALKEPAQRALNFIMESQHPEFGGWRYRPRFESDTSVSGWQLMALKSGEMAGLTVSKAAYQNVGRWLDSVKSKTADGQYSYHPSRDASPAMTAEGLLMRQYLGAKRDDAQLIAGATFLRTRLPDFGQRDAYYWYYATQVMFHMQGDHWSEWNAALRDMLVTTQSKGGPMGGSWDPARPTPEKWANGGGRHYLTCVNLLMLEVYYRHLPLYLELEK